MNVKLKTHMARRKPLVKSVTSLLIGRKRRDAGNGSNRNGHARRYNREEGSSTHSECEEVVTTLKDSL